MLIHILLIHLFFLSIFYFLFSFISFSPTPSALGSCNLFCLAPRQCWIEKIELWSGCRRQRVANSFFRGHFPFSNTASQCCLQFPIWFWPNFTTNYYWWAHSAEGHSRDGFSRRAGWGGVWRVTGLRPLTRTGIRLVARRTRFVRAKANIKCQNRKRKRKKKIKMKITVHILNVWWVD